jgi:hypothetical protein
MTRAQVANHMNNRHPDPNTMYQVVQAYYLDVLGKQWNPNQVDIRMLERAYGEAINALARHYSVHLLYDTRVKPGQPHIFIKAF